MKACACRAHRGAPRSAAARGPGMCDHRQRAVRAARGAGRRAPRSRGRATGCRGAGRGGRGPRRAASAPGMSVRRKYSSRKRRCSSLMSLARRSTTPSSASKGWMSSRKHRCCSSTSSCTRAATRRPSSPRGVCPVRPRRDSSPARMCRLRRGHADHEELVQVRAEDGEELDPLQQRHAGILRLVEDAPVELQPRQLAIDEVFRAH